MLYNNSFNILSDNKCLEINKYSSCDLLSNSQIYHTATLGNNNKSYFVTDDTFTKCLINNEFKQISPACQVFTRDEKFKLVTNTPIITSKPEPNSFVAYDETPQVKEFISIEQKDFSRLTKNIKVSYQDLELTPFLANSSIEVRNFL